MTKACVEQKTEPENVPQCSRTIIKSYPAIDDFGIIEDAMATRFVGDPTPFQ